MAWTNEICEEILLNMGYSKKRAFQDAGKLAIQLNRIKDSKKKTSKKKDLQEVLMEEY